MNITLRKTSVLALSLVLLVVLTGCNEAPLPYVFEGVMQAGVENAPPVEVTLDTELPVVQDEVLVYRVETVDEEYIASLANRLGFNDGGRRPTNASNPYIYSRDTVEGRLEGNAMALEISQDGRIWMYGPISSINKEPENLPSFEEAKKIASDWLVSNDLYPANVTDVIKGGGLVVTNSVTGASTAYSIVVNFQTRLDEYDIYSPVASIEVGDNGKILSASIKNTQIKDDRFVTLKNPEAALDILKAHLASPLANPPEARESLINLRNFNRLSVTQVTLQYTKVGGYLQPIYVFKGNAYSDRSPGFENFIGKVDAVAR